MKYIAPILLVALTGCCTPDKLTAPGLTGTPTDLLLSADPTSVTNEDLADKAAERGNHHWAFSQVEGVTWQPMHYDLDDPLPDGYGSGGDSALFTGYALAAYAFQAAHTGDPVAVSRALTSLRGIYYLTHVAGPGVIARCAFPIADAISWKYPEQWAYRAAKYPGHVVETNSYLDGPPFPPPVLNAPFAPSVYYTRATRDQLSGLVFGMSVAWAVLPESHLVVALIVKRLYLRLHNDDWKIRDANGNNSTSADGVGGILKTAFLRLYASTSGDADIQRLYEDTFVTSDLGDLFNVFSNADSYYAHNLRAARSMAGWMLETNPTRKAAFASYYLDNVWRHTKGHRSAWFAYVAAAVGDSGAAAEGRASLSSLFFRPTRAWPSPYAGQDYAKPNYACVIWGQTAPFALPPHLRYANTSYFIWQKPPWRLEDTPADMANPPLKEATGLSYLLPYWLARYFGDL